MKWAFFKFLTWIKSTDCWKKEESTNFTWRSSTRRQYILFPLKEQLSVGLSSKNKPSSSQLSRNWVSKWIKSTVGFRRLVREISWQSFKLKGFFRFIWLKWHLLPRCHSKWFSEAKYKWKAHFFSWKLLKTNTKKSFIWHQLFRGTQK